MKSKLQLLKGIGSLTISSQPNIYTYTTQTRRSQSKCSIWPIPQSNIPKSP